MKTAQAIPRIGLARARGEHLTAANDSFCDCWEGQGRDCEACREASVSALRGLWPAFAVLGIWLVLGLVFS